MIAALDTLPFLATLWLLVVVGAAVLEESGTRIAAALKGETVHQPVAGRLTVRMRARSRSPQVRSAEPRLRAAA